MGIISFPFLKQHRNTHGEWSSREPESNGCSHSFVFHDGVAGEIPSISTPKMMGHLGIIFTWLS